MPLDFRVVLNCLDLTVFVYATENSIEEFKVVYLILRHRWWINSSFHILILLLLWYINVHVNLLR